MHNRLRNLMLFGSLAALLAAIVAGGASARVLISGGPVAPATSHVEQTAALPGYSDFPDVVRPMKDTHAQKPLAAPGYSDFPEVVRTMKDTNAVATSVGGSDSDTSGLALGIGIGVGVAVVLAFFAVRRRRRRTASAMA